MTQKEWLNKFSNRLTSMMNVRHISQNQLARESNISVSRINDYVNGRSVPSVYALINLAYTLDTTVSELADFNERIRK